jgi:hypothetical protein
MTENVPPTRYEIRVREWLDPSWSEWLGGLALHHEDDGTTTLRGTLPDQAALSGVIARLRDLGLTLLSLRSSPTAPEQGGDDA